MQKLGLEENYWFGHQRLEYVDIGRFWQRFLFAGPFIWQALMVRESRVPEGHRGAAPASTVPDCVGGHRAVLRGRGEGRCRQTNLAVVAHWRWVVHLWVQRGFEVLATVV